MTKKRRLLSLLLCLWMLLPLFAVFSVPASAAGMEEMDASDVVDDLNVMGVDLAKYPANAADDRVEIIKFLEFGYKSNGDYSEYGLYLYLYNPCGKAVTGDKNAVQLAYELNAGGVTSYIKYRLTVLSRSTGSGRENVFLKVKVEGAEAIAPMLNKAARQYRISGVEILRPGDSNATDYRYGGGSFTFTGYHKGCNSNDYSTLRCIADKLDVVELELHPVTYYSEKEAPSADVRKYDEVFGVYFSVPEWVVVKYGNLNDASLKGLEAVKGCYTEATVNGMMTDSDALLNLYKDSTVDKSDIYFWNYSRSIGSGPSVYRYATPSCKPYLPKNSVVTTIPYFTYLNMFRKNNCDVTGLPSAEFAEFYRSAGRNALSRTQKNYTITKDDIGTVKPYVSWWESVRNWFKGKEDPGAVSFDMLQRITASEAKSLSVSKISETFKVTEADAEALKGFALNAKNDYTYVMHFAVRDCVSAKITEAGTLDRDAILDYFDEVPVGNSYYFEKTVFEEFDVLELHYRNKENKLSVVPVSASPIDVTGGIPAPGQSDPNAKPSDTSFWKTLLKAVAVILVIVLLILAVRLFGGFGKLFGAIGRGLTKGFRSAQKQFRTWKASRKKKAPRRKKPKKKKIKKKKEKQS